MKDVDTSKVKYYVKKVSELSEHEMAECADLFSRNYGYYRNDAPFRPGARIKMSTTFFSDRYMHDDVNIAMARNGKYLIGQAIYIRKHYVSIGTMTWVLQLVVADHYRRFGIGSTLLYSIWGMSNDFAWGLATANPCTVKALEGATFRKCDPAVILKNIEYIKQLANETGFVKPDSYRVNETQSVVNTEFFVDNSDYVDAYRSIKDWKLGSLEPGYEWLAFTFRNQPVDEEKYRNHFEQLMEFSENKLIKAYSRMKIHDHSWAKGERNEIDHIINVTCLKPGSTVLDVGCAIGRHSFELARRGYFVKGIDNAARHISIAQKQKSNWFQKENSVHLDFEEADIRAYEEKKQYEMVIARKMDFF